MSRLINKGPPSHEFIWWHLEESLQYGIAVDTHTHQPLLSRPPIFRAGHGMSSSAIQLRISVLQLNSAIPEQNESSKPSGEKSADNPHLQSPAGNTVSLRPFTQRQISCVCESMSVCGCRRGRVSVHTLHPFVDRCLFSTEPE